VIASYIGPEHHITKKGAVKSLKRQERAAISNADDVGTSYY
jgi:hypothetical protein